MPYEVYVINRSKQMPTDSYFYTARYIAKFMISNSSGPVRRQNMSNSKMSAQNVPNSRVCSTNKSESKRINMDEKNQIGST